MKRLILSLILCLFSSPLFAGEIRLSVAASLKDAINELGDVFSQKYPEVRLVKSYGASGALARQIANGAPADIFISANQEWMDYLKGEKLLETETISILAYNSLVFAGNTRRKVAGMSDLTSLEKIAIGSPKSVPAGEYAVDAMRRAGIDSQLRNRLVMAKDVRECLLYAELGEVDGAFVYLTDALQSRKTRILFTVPAGIYPRIVYPMGMTSTGAKKVDVLAFYRFLQSPSSRAVLGRYGFVLK